MAGVLLPQEFVAELGAVTGGSVNITPDPRQGQETVSNVGGQPGSAATIRGEDIVASIRVAGDVQCREGRIRCCLASNDRAPLHGTAKNGSQVTLDPGMNICPVESGCGKSIR
jgi:hypothetical protein